MPAPDQETCVGHLVPRDAALISKAIWGAARHLGLPGPVLATILGLSASAVEQVRESQTPVIQDWRMLEHATPLLRLSTPLTMASAIQTQPRAG